MTSTDLPTPANPERQQLFTTAILDADIDTLESLLAPEFRYIDTNIKTAAKVEFLALVRSGDIAAPTSNTEQIDVDEDDPAFAATFTWTDSDGQRNNAGTVWSSDSERSKVRMYAHSLPRANA